MLKLAFVVFLGSGLGGVCRYFASEAVNRLMQSLCINIRQFSMFPSGTLFVNILGCLIIGAVYGGINKGVDMTPEMKTFLTAGFCGGLTTFSTFSHENYLLFQGNHLATLFIYILSSLVLGLLAAYEGYYIMKS